MKRSVLVLLFIVSIVSLKAQDVYQAKAFFIYNFTRLVEWPSDGSGEFVIGVVGNSPITNHLEKLTAGKRVSSQNIVVKRFKTAEEVTGCNILYVAASASSKLYTIQSKLQNQNTLIVGEKRGLTDEGAAINFILNNNKLSFHINVDNANKQGLKVSKSLIDMSTQS